MRRIALVSAVLGLLIVADGIFQQVTKYKQGETQNVLNLSNVTLTDGWTLIISGAVVLVVAVIAFALSARPTQSTPASPASTVSAPSGTHVPANQAPAE
jgi:hypothetical protein